MSPDTKRPPNAGAQRTSGTAANTAPASAAKPTPAPAAKSRADLSPSEALRRRVRETREALPQGVALHELLLALANRPDVARLVAEAFPGVAPVDLRRALATASGLVRLLEEWTERPAADAAARKKGRPKAGDRRPEAMASPDETGAGKGEANGSAGLQPQSTSQEAPAAPAILIMDPDGSVRPLGATAAVGRRLPDRATDTAAHEAARSGGRENTGASGLQPPASGLPHDIASHHAVKIHVDGASKGNPGPSAAGIVVTDVEGEVIYEEGIYLGEMTNNAAEYCGLIRALQILAENGRPLTYVFADSLLMVNQMNLEWQVKHPDIRRLFSQAQILKRRLPKFEIRHVPREENSRADELANQAIKESRRAK